MLKRTSKLLIATLILLELGIIAIATLPPRMTTVKAALETDMPVVFVDPLDVTADVGESFTISVKVFNLSGDFYTTDEPWSEGEPLPPLLPNYWRYNLSLGHLYALTLRLKWDPTILEYVSHTVMVPVEDHAGGILHEPIIAASDTVDPVAGTYWLSRSSQAPAPAFNARDANATAFTMTFTVKKAGKCDISFTDVELVVDLVGLGFPFSVPQEIPHWVKNGQFQTGELLTRIEMVEVGASIEGELHDPVIHGEYVTVKTTVRNDGLVTDTYNLSLRMDTTFLDKWENEALAPDTSKTFSHTITGLDIGVYNVTAEAAILHESEAKTDELSSNFTVIDTPTLQINGPSSATAGQRVGFDASESVHNDPNGNIMTYTWTLWAPGETQARSTRTGESASFLLPPVTENSDNWTVMLVVKDNFDVTAKALTGQLLTPTSELLRLATEPYRASALLEVMQPLVISILTPENKSYQTDDLPLVFTVNRAASWMGYSLDGQANVTLAGNSTLTDLSHGSHSIRVFAEDEAGIFGSETIHFSAKDTTPPTLSVTSPENKTYGTNEIQLTFSVSEPVLWMAYSLDGQANVTILSSSSLISGLSPGAHRVRVFAEDLHGNTGSSETIRFTVKTQAFPLEIAAAIVVIAIVAVGCSAYIIKARRCRKPKQT